jgi:uncharacterized protein (DUF433 family)
MITDGMKTDEILAAYPDLEVADNSGGAPVRH